MRTLPLLVLPLAAATLSACEPDPVLAIETATIVVNAVEGRPAAGYLTLHGGPVDQYLEFASVPYAGRTEMHETVSANGRTTMRKIDRVPVPAGSTVEFKPGGKHLMIFDLNPYVLQQGRTLVSLRFTDGSQATYSALVRTQGQPAE